MSTEVGGQADGVGSMEGCLWGWSCVCLCVCVRDSVSLEPPCFPSTRLPLCECVAVCAQACLCVPLNGGFVPQSVPLYFARFLMIFQWWFSLCVQERKCLRVCVQGRIQPLSFLSIPGYSSRYRFVLLFWVWVSLQPQYYFNLNTIVSPFWARYKVTAVHTGSWKLKPTNYKLCIQCFVFLLIVSQSLPYDLSLIL